MDTGIGGRARRVIAVLAIAVGVLAMHGLASGHHGAVPAAPALTAATVAVEHAAGAAHAAEHAGDQALSAVALVSLHNVPAGGCDRDCGEHPSGLVLLCAAVLLAAAGAMVLGHGRRTWRAVPSTGPPKGARTSTSAPLRRLVPVADLCISRT